MPDEDGHVQADEETLPKTPLHAYKEGREDDVQGDVEKLKEGRREDMNPQDLDSEAETGGGGDSTQKR